MTQHRINVGQKLTIDHHENRSHFNIQYFGDYFIRLATIQHFEPQKIRFISSLWKTKIVFLLEWIVNRILAKKSLIVFEITLIVDLELLNLHANILLLIVQNHLQVSITNTNESYFLRKIVYYWYAYFVNLSFISEPIPLRLLNNVRILQYLVLLLRKLDDLLQVVLRNIN